MFPRSQSCPNLSGIYSAPSQKNESLGGVERLSCSLMLAVLFFRHAIFH